MQGRGSTARGQLLRHVSSGPDPACGQQRCRMAQLRRPGAARGFVSAYSEARGRHVSGQRHCSLPGSRAPARRARPLHLLPPAALQPVRNDAASARSLPARWPGLRAGGGEAGRRRGGRGREQTENLRRRLPPVPGAEAETAGRVRGGTPARPGPARPTGRRMGVSLRREPKLRKLPGTGAFLEEKQTVTSALVPGVRASSFRSPGLAAPFLVFCTQTLCFQSLLGAPAFPPADTHTQGSRFRPFRLLVSPSVPSFTSCSLQITLLSQDSLC
ncbi:uncharacterized protein LOC122680557 isoform X1 [Cervus elaphus]|uniref:uncharacterized protein LOC122423673 isoform X1 n=1 Tax=Cervus canadensis TaxID=1574408 RepID=UPI001CA323EE|nr:uncharacterized protein LOC122423673 isoform X1 [Cervus canadensis]XP_043738015.1 uncharacterized protein LOC122680557 isoform X1 [Cervus elaphus]